MRNNSLENPYVNLLYGVIRRAAEDYIREYKWIITADKKIKDNSVYLKHEKELSDLEMFFYDGLKPVMTPAAGRNMVAYMRRKVRREVVGNRTRHG